MNKSKLQKVKEWIENGRENRLKDEIANDDEDSKAIFKFFHHWNRHGEVVESNYGVVYSSPFYLLVRSQFYSEKKARGDPDNIGTFHGIWVIGIDETQESGYFIHRLDHDKSDSSVNVDRFEDRNYEWTKEDIKDKMGFDEHYTGQEVENHTRYRIQGDITIERVNGGESEDNKFISKETESDVLEKIGSYFERKDFSKSELVDRDYGDKKKYMKKLYRYLRVNTKYDLPSGYRIEKDYDHKIMNPENPDLDGIIESDISNDVRQYNATIGNHLIMVEDVDRDSVGVLRQGIKQRFTAPESTHLFIIHDEHNNQKISLPAGRYEINAMDRHQQS